MQSISLSFIPDKGTNNLIKQQIEDVENKIY